jgi:hypothetical protein
LTKQERFVNIYDGSNRKKTEKKRSPLGTSQRRQYVLFYTVTTIECACSSGRNSGQEKRIKWTTSNNMVDHELELVHTLFDTYCIQKQNDDRCIVKDVSIDLSYKKEKKKSDTITHT